MPPASAEEQKKGGVFQSTGKAVCFRAQERRCFRARKAFPCGLTLAATAAGLATAAMAFESCMIERQRSTSVKGRAEDSAVPQ